MFKVIAICFGLLLSISWVNRGNALSDAEISAFVSKTYIETNTGVQGTVSITTPSSDPSVLELSSNGVPDHATGTFPSSSNPNSLEVQSYNWKIPKNPTYGTTTTCLPQGPIAMAVNGVPMFNPYSIGCCDTGVEELDLFDVCFGHPAPAPAGAYHYHLNPTCLFELKCNEPSTIIGVAFDGFPIYGPNDADGTLLTTADLDECNGKVTNGEYRYHITNDFPYIMGCYNGTVRSDAGIQISTNCQCTEVANPCTEFGGRRRKKRAVTDISFQCCVDNVNCTTSEVTTGDSNIVSSASVTLVSSTSASTTSSAILFRSYFFLIISLSFISFKFQL
uniref:uncharacterized protein LOC120331432 n=1 Tax=Styela clava TaxID=7725 RepID=UPI001939CDDB|nr:uncharacterized protein LOC120331432 [Styela clava]